ncbi:MAG: polyprenyl synthetase family protein [Anaerolineales bacterium]
MPEQIWQIIEGSWSQSQAWPEFKAAMRSALPRNTKRRKNADQDPSRWAILPGLCCHSAGGQIQWANDIAAAWLLFYIAADIMDTIEDCDQPEKWWQELGPGAAINVASGHFFSAAHLLDSLHKKSRTSRIATEIIERLTSGFLIMCSGQQRDLTEKSLSLESYWQITRAKSGEFFGMACWAGARLATGDIFILERYQEFGHHLGSLIQILDDLEEFNHIHEIRSRQTWQNLRKSLPFVYAFEVFPAEKKNLLLELLNQDPADATVIDEMIRLLEETGVVVYLLAEMERYRALAKKSLARANPVRNAAEYLERMLIKLGPNN